MLDLSPFLTFPSNLQCPPAPRKKGKMNDSVQISSLHGHYDMSSYAITTLSEFDTLQLDNIFKQIIIMFSQKGCVTHHSVRPLKFTTQAHIYMANTRNKSEKYNIELIKRNYQIYSSIVKLKLSPNRVPC